MAHVTHQLMLGFEAMGKDRARGNPVFSIPDLVKLHYDEVFRFCARRVGSSHAPDAAQETFVTAQKVLRFYRGHSTVKTWLFGIALNECRRLLRSRHLQEAPIDLELTGSASYEGTIIQRTELNAALNGLTPAHREVVLLHELEGLTYEEISKVTGVPLGTVKSRLFHAFRQLRTALGEAL